MCMFILVLVVYKVFILFTVTYSERYAQVNDFGLWVLLDEEFDYITLDHHWWSSTSNEGFHECCGYSQFWVTEPPTIVILN